MKPSRLSLSLLLVASSAVGCVIGPKPEDPTPSLTADGGTDGGLFDDGGDLTDATADTKAVDTGIGGGDTAPTDASGDATPPPSDGADDAKSDGDGATDADATDALADGPTEGG